MGTSLQVRTNASQATDVTIGDMGIIVPSGGGSITLSEHDELQKARGSRDLLTLVQDEIFGPDSSTLILNDPEYGTDIDPDHAELYLSSAGMESQYGVSGFRPYAVMKFNADANLDLNGQAIVDVDNIYWTPPQTWTFDTATENVAWSFGDLALATISTDVTTITFTDPGGGAQAGRFTLIVRQDGVGGNSIAGWPANVVWPNGVVPSIDEGANAETILHFVWDGTDYFGVRWDDDAAASVGADSITNTELANMAQATIKGRAAGAGTGDPVDLTATQATAILNAFTSALKGLVPASGGGTVNFLRADGTFAAPPSGGSPSSSIQEATDTITINTGTDTLMTGMTVTPGAGTYLVIGSALVNTTNKNGTVSTSIFAAGAKETASERSHSGDTANSSHTMIARVTVGAGEAIELRWNQVGSGNGEAANRQLFVQEVS